MPVPEETKPRGMIYAQYTGPGPLGYSLPTTIGRGNVDSTRNHAPAYSMGIRHHEHRENIPGPGYNIDSNVTSRGKKEGPSYSFNARPKPVFPKAIEVTPGPGSYNYDKVKQGAMSTERNGPKISMGTRACYQFKNCAPAPNTYNANVTPRGNRNAPSWSLKPRLETGKIEYNAVKANVPGPGSYKMPEIAATKRTTGSYSMQGRTKVKNYNTVLENPGPGSYNPSLNGSGRQYSMGVRHSDYICQVLTDLDVA